MLCSECKKNAAILFYNKVENGKETMEGLCYDCAKKKGINPLDVLSKQSDLLNKDKINLNDMSKQLETVFKDLAENINLEDIENMVQLHLILKTKIVMMKMLQKLQEPLFHLVQYFQICLDLIGSETSSDNTGRKKVKVEKKKNNKQSKKKKYFLKQTILILYV